ncbi:FapA family protein [uncultured Psychrosphaera sp.]|uniref:DUF342 domain-containing protein n=1 Tax=uncultured Psychrosphaera sp. TaxID=1403522 RepID=UPI0030F5B378
MQNFEYKFSKKQLTLSTILNQESEPLDASAITKQLQQSEYSNLEVQIDNIAKFVKSANIKLADIKKNKLPPKPIETIAAKAVDAMISISIDKEKMSVEAQVTTPIGGIHIDLAVIKKTCINSGVRYGLKSSLIKELLTLCKEAEPGTLVTHEIAKGLHEVNGNNAYLTPLVELFSESFRNPKEQADGSVDLKDLGNIDTVTQDQPVLEKIPYTSGTEGMNVFGESIPAIPGKDIKLPLNPSVKVSPDNPNLLLANKEGLVRFDGKELVIDDVFMLPELDPQKGHVKFKGSVVIQGDVSPDMKLTATGDVVIGGFVESAVIKCGGELTILSGASGRIEEDKTNGQHYTCILQSGGQINLDFANQCEITAKTLVNVKRQVSHCIITANSLKVGQGKKPKGQITGGRFLLCKTLEAGTIGTESNVATDISMNRTYDIFINKEIELADWIQEMVTRRENLEVSYNSTMDPNKKLELEPQLTMLQSKIERYTGYRAELIKKRREYMDNVFVKVNTKLYPKVSFFMTDNAVISEEKGPSVIKIDDFELKILPLI